MNCPQCCKPLHGVTKSQGGKEWLCLDCQITWQIKKVGILAGASQEQVEHFLKEMAEVKP